ncbi:MAG: hypothetical protein ACRYFS_13065, partial [Janthinobacterium lividum]
YYIKDAMTEKTLFGAVRSQSWKSRISVFKVQDNSNCPAFSIQARDILSWTYKIVDNENQTIGLLDRANCFSPFWQAEDTQSGLIAQTISVLPSLGKEYSLNLDGQAICLFRKDGSFYNPVIQLECLNASQININLMLSIGILLLNPGSSDGAAGAG